MHDVRAMEKIIPEHLFLYRGYSILADKHGQNYLKFEIWNRPIVTFDNATCIVCNSESFTCIMSNAGYCTFAEYLDINICRTYRC